MITSRRIIHLLTLVEHGHFGRAAKALNISQPALSKSIQGLESDLGVTLLERQRGQLALTAFGELVARRGNDLITADADLRREISMLANNEIGSLAVILGPYPSMISGYLAAARLLEKHPGVRLSIRVMGWRDIAGQIEQHQADLGIAEISSLEDLPQFSTVRVSGHPGHFFCRPGHPILDQKTISAADLVAYPWVATRLPQRLVALLPKSLGLAGRIDPLNGDFVPAIEIAVPMQLGRLVMHSDALALSTLSIMERALEAGELAVVPQNRIPLSTGYGAISLRNRSLPPAAIAFLRELQAVEAEIVERETLLAKKFIRTGRRK